MDDNDKRLLKLVHEAILASGYSVEEFYGEAVNANVTPLPVDAVVPPVDPAAQAAYNRAFNLLYVESPLYRNYKNKKSLYNAKLATYLTNFLKYDVSKPEDARKWSILAPTLQADVDIAYDDFQAASPGVVETALNTLGQYEASTLATIFARAKQLAERSGIK